MSIHTEPHANAPLPFVAETLERVSTATTIRRALDVACGKGRHLALLEQAGWEVFGVDRDGSSLQQAARDVSAAHLSLLDVEAPSEQGQTPFPQEWKGHFELVLTTFFLFRPLVPFLAEMLAPGGTWCLETFHIRNHTEKGRPRRSAFCLQEGEASALAQGSGLVVEHVEEALHQETWTTQMCARKPS